MKFSYQRYFVQQTVAFSPNGVVDTPEIPVTIEGPFGKECLLALVDTGADGTLFPKSVGNAIGVSIDDQDTTPIHGFSGHGVDVAHGEVVLEITDSQESFRWLAEVGFVDYPDPADERLILGHTGFLDYFRVTFDGNAKELEIELAAALPSGQT